MPQQGRLGISFALFMIAAMPTAYGMLPEYLRLPNVLCKGFFNLRPVLREDDIILCNQLIHISYRVDTVRPISQWQPREGLYHLPPFVLL